MNRIYSNLKTYEPDRKSAILQYTWQDFNSGNAVAKEIMADTNTNLIDSNIY